MRWLEISGVLLAFYVVFIIGWQRFMQRIQPPDPPGADDLERIKRNDEKFMARIHK